MKTRFLGAILVISCQLLVSGQSFENGMNFNLPWDDTLTSEFFPHFPAAAIGESDAVSIDAQGNFVVNGEACRFFGANLTTQGAFPVKSTAPAIAGRMRKFGINLIRFHHIDNPWSDGSLFYNIDGTRAFNQDLLDRLDYFIYQLKLHGIYVNMNLNVSRTFESSDGVIAADSLDSYGKGITQFDPYLISLQKEYAGMLLNHLNPYTGLRLSEDPVLAMVEIINENSLFRLWYGNKLQSYNKRGVLPVYYLHQLDSLWQDFLNLKYENTPDLKEVWNTASIAGDTLINEGFENGISASWSVELHNTAGASAEAVSESASGDSAVKVNVTSTSDLAWHTKFKYSGITVKKDSIYELYFKAKSSEPRNISVIFQKGTTPYTYYLGRGITITEEYQEYMLTFKALEDNNANLFIAFSFNNQLGEFYFDDFIFKTRSITGLEDNERLEDRNVKRVSANEMLAFSPQRIMDQTAFYSEIQLDFLGEMKRFLNDTLSITAPITGSNWFTGPESVYVQKDMDYIDNHAYWDHPHFPNKAWDQSDWRIGNSPMLTAGSGTIESLFGGMMVKDKPYTVSEYNHAYPNQFQAELFPIITSYLSFNDADGIMIFSYGGSWDWVQNKISSYFEIHRNSSLMGSMPLFSYVFRNKLISPDDTPILIDYSHKDILRIPLLAQNSNSNLYPYDQAYGYTNRIEISFDNPIDFDNSSLPPLNSGPYSLNNGEINWDKAGLLKINTAQFASICGYLQNFSTSETEMMVLESASDFGAVNWLSLKDSALNETSLSILNIGTKMMNTDMLWDGLETVHNNWGKVPSLVAPLDISLKLKTIFTHLKAFPLNEHGLADTTQFYIFKTGEDGFAEVELSQQEDQTIWYGIVGMNLQEDSSAVDTTVVDTTSIKTHKIFEEPLIYPNPVVDHINMTLNYSMVDARIQIRDLSGKLFFDERKKGKFTIDTGNWIPGTYLYKIISDQMVFTGKIQKL